MSKVNFHDSDDNSLEFVNLGMIFVGPQLVSTSPASPRMGGVPEIAEAYCKSKHSLAWLAPWTVSGESMRQFINPLK